MVSSLSKMKSTASPRTSTSKSSTSASLPDTVSLLELVIFFEFVISFAIFILATVGVAVGYNVSSFYVLALLQVVIAAPGVAHVALKSTLLLAVFVSCQVITAVAELFWIVYIIAQHDDPTKWFGLAVLFLVQALAILAVFVRRDTAIQFSDNLVPRIIKMRQNLAPKQAQQKPNLQDPTSLSSKESIPTTLSPNSSTINSKSSPKKKRKLRKDQKKQQQQPKSQQSKNAQRETSSSLENEPSRPKLTAPMDSLCE